ncbi:MAG: beta-galactosidase [Paenibacillaceae bacterium]|nr:beta-galactosidase [Paenibacillaceae bacterium]
MFVFGSQYLRSWTPRMRDWDRDLANMKAHGFNTIRAWLVWNVLELDDGVYNWDYLDTFGELVAKHGLQVGYLFHLQGAPEWMVRRYPQFYEVDANGKPFEPSARTSTPSGGWPGLNYDYPEVRDLEERFISAVVRHLANRKEIAFWEPMNEPHNIINFASPEHTTFGYGEATRAKFRQWLRRKYGDLAQLNAAWLRHHNSWDEVRPVTWRYGYRDVVDFRLFLIDNLAEEIAWRTDVIRRHDARPVIAHSWGGGSITCPHLGGMAFDDWRNARCFDMWGFSAFPSGLSSHSMLGFSTDAARSAANGKTFWQAELGAGDHSGGFGRKGRAKKEQLAIWTWESIRHGAKGVLYWQYRKEAHGHEIGGYGLTDYAGNPTDRLREVAAIGRLLNKYERCFNDSSPAPAEVALLFSLQSYLVDWCDHRSCTLSIDCMSGYYRMLWEHNIPVDIVHEEFAAAEQLRRYKLIIVPHPAAPLARSKQLLQEYVHAGGCILADPYFAAFDDDLLLDHTVPGSGFERLFGCEEDDIRNEPAVDIVYRDRTLKLTGAKLKETFRHVTGEVLATYADGSGAALVRGKYGAGSALISGVHLGLTYALKTSLGDELTRVGTHEAAADAQAIVLDLVRELHIEAPVVTGNPCVQSSLLLNRDAEDVLIVINNSESPQQADIRFGGRTYRQAVLIVGHGKGGIAETAEAAGNAEVEESAGTAGTAEIAEGRSFAVSLSALEVHVYLLR